MYIMTPERWSMALQQVQIIDKATGVIRDLMAEDLCATISKLNMFYGFSTARVLCKNDRVQLSKHAVKNQEIFEKLSLASDETREQRAQIERAVKDLNI
jgi:hypothetical protein